MPNTREKLIELLETVVPREEVACCGEVPVSTSRVADHLIANGVTFQNRDIHWATERAYKNGCEAGKPKWIPVTERLPEHGDIVLCHTKHDDLLVFQWCEMSHRWVDQYEDYRQDYITHWMPLPEAPKGE